MADSRIRLTIRVNVKPAVSAIARVVYSFHPPRDVEQGSECAECIEPWPCEALRDFERRTPR